MILVLTPQMCAFSASMAFSGALSCNSCCSICESHQQVSCVQRNMFVSRMHAPHSEDRVLQPCKVLRILSGIRELEHRICLHKRIHNHVLHRICFPERQMRKSRLVIGGYICSMCPNTGPHICWQSYMLAQLNDPIRIALASRCSWQCRGGHF